MRIQFPWELPDYMYSGKPFQKGYKSNFTRSGKVGDGYTKNTAQGESKKKRLMTKESRRRNRR